MVNGSMNNDVPEWNSGVNYPLISILIPTYNRSGLLAMCIESVLSQDYPSLEVIVSDNCSTDSTRQMIQQYLKDSRLQYYSNETNLGVIPNWKKLLYEYASGEYGKLLCDDDCLFDPQHLKKAIELMQRENLALVLSGSVLQKEEENGRWLDIVYDPKIPEITDTQWWLENGGKKFGPHRLFLNFSSGAVFNVQKARELQVFIPDTYGPDYEALFRFMLSGRIGYLKGHHFTGRYHASNEGTREDFKEATKGLKIFERIYDFGLAREINPKILSEFKRRHLVVFVNTFLIPKWFRERGVSWGTVNGFRKFLARIDKGLFLRIISSYPTLCWLLRLKNEKLYKAIKGIMKTIKKSV